MTEPADKRVKSLDEPPIIEPTPAPEVFITGVLRADVDASGAVKLTCVSFRQNLPSEVSQVVNLRIVMTMAGFKGSVEYLSGVLANWEAIQAPPPPGTTAH